MWDPEQLQRWVNALNDGEVVAAPAEGVYGYCVDPFNEKALERLAAKKGRSHDKGFIVLINKFSEMKDLTRIVNEGEKEVISHSWPGSTTIVFLAKSTLSPLLTGNRDTIAIRMPAENYMKEYLRAWGRPLVSTSLNLSGGRPVTEPERVPESVVSLRLPNRLNGKESRIYDAINYNWIRH
jgi:L-threonylcarbamoyladenylate synthase